MIQKKFEAIKIFRICKMTTECIVSGHYGPLEECRALSRVSEQDIRRVLKEYNPRGCLQTNAGHNKEAAVK